MPASTSAFAFGSRSTTLSPAASGAPRERAPVNAASRSCAGAPARATSAVGARAIALAGEAEDAREALRGFTAKLLTFDRLVNALAGD